MGLTDAENERLAAEAGMSREEWEEAQRVAEAKREAEKATGSLFGGGESFSIAGERVPRKEAVRIAREFGALSESEGVRVVAPEVYAEDGKEARSFAREVYRKLQEETAGGKLLEMPDGRRAKVSRRGLSEVQHHSADRRVLAALCALRDLCRQSIYINSAANTQPEKKGKKGIVRFHYYIAKGNFVGASAVNERAQDEAYVNIVLSEHENGDLFYDLDATNVEDVNKNEGVSATLPEARLPRTGEQEGEAPYVGRIQQTKQFVNYVNKKIKEEGSGNHGSFSVTEVKERGLFDKSGVLKAGNAVVVEPAAFTSFSEFALHASPVNHDGFDTSFIGSGEGHKAFGWGVYAAESPDVNEMYKSQFSKPRFVEPKIFGVRIDTLDMKSKEGKELIERILPEIRFSAPRNPFNRWNGSELEEADKQQLRDAVAEVITDARKLVNEGKADIYWQAFSLLRNQKKYPYFGNIEGALEKLIKITRKEGGYTNYKVEILVEKDEMLLWDEPVPPKMRRKLMPLVKEARKKVRELLKEVRKNPNIYNVSESECERLLEELNDASLFESGERLYWKIAEALGSDKETSLGMDRLGVHAIKYLDGNSRKGKTKEKTNNYVVFDGDRVKITHKATEESNYEWREVDWKPRAQNEGDVGGASMSVVIPRRSICRTRQEALATVGGRGGSLILENRFLNLKAVFNSKSKGKFAHKDSLGRTFEALQPSGMSDEDIKTAHFSAYGNIVELFANAERMKYERAYKDKEVRKGFLHVYSPFELEGMGERFEANIELMIFKEKGKAPMAYLLNVSLASASGQKGRGAGFPNLPIYLSGEIKSDFPDIVKQEKEKNYGGSFSVIGPRAKTFSKYVDKAFLGRDDGKMRAEIDASQARLKGAWKHFSKDDLLKLLDERATPEEKKKLDEFRKVSDDWLEALDRDPEKFKKWPALDKRLKELRKELEEEGGLAEGRVNILVSHLFPLLLTVLLTTKSMSALLLKSSLTSPWQHRHNGNDEFLYEQVFPAHCLHDYPVGMHIRFKTGRFTDHP